MVSKLELPVRRSPFHNDLELRGAVFGGTSGWHYPLWFRSLETELTYEQAIGSEQLLVRSAVGVSDMTCLTQILVIGPDAVRVLNWLSVSEADMKVGTVRYTHWCDDDGTISVDLALTRHDTNRFVVCVNDTAQTLALQTVSNAIAELNAAAVAVDVTSSFASLVVAGPKSRETLQKLTRESLADESLQPQFVRQIEMIGVPIEVGRISYVGGLSFEVHIPTEYAEGLGRSILKAAEESGGGAVGMDAIYALGTESGRVDMDYNIDQTLNPFEAGIGFTVDLNKPDQFRGRAALLEAARSNPRRRLVFASTSLSNHPEWNVGMPLGKNGRSVGIVRTIDRCVFSQMMVAVALVEHELPEGVSSSWLSGSWRIGDDPVSVSTSGVLSRHGHPLHEAASQTEP